MSLDRNVEFRVDVREEFGAGETVVAGEGPAETSLPGVRGDEAAGTGEDDEDFEDDSAGLAAESLVEEFEDRNVGGSRGDGFEVREREHHGDQEEPGGGETDSDGSHDGNGDHALGLVDFLGHVRSAVKAGKSPVGVDKTDNEGNAILLPASVVDEGREDELGGLVGRGLRGHGDEDHGEGDERDVQGEGRDGRERLSVAVEEESEQVEELVRDDNVPGFNYAVAHKYVSRGAKRNKYGTFPIETGRKWSRTNPGGSIDSNQQPHCPWPMQQRPK